METVSGHKICRAGRLHVVFKYHMTYNIQLIKYRRVDSTE
jgi:hypothetical protein